jgi:hypothetical protein
MKRLELEPDEKPTDVKASSVCGVRGCENNLFGFCQIKPNIDKNGNCISRRDR